jgi:transposase
VKLAEGTLQNISVAGQGPGRPPQRPLRIIADRGYDSDPLRWRLLQRGMLLLSPHRRNRRRPSVNDGRMMRRYRKRWKVERTFAWLGNFRRLVVRYDRRLDMYRAFFHLACALITLRFLVK